MNTAPVDPFEAGILRDRVEHFAELLPQILSRDPETANLAIGLDNLMENVDLPFTVAVVGQMRVGKSTLLNALVGEDLAITGVNETTATLNWIKHGEGDLLDQFKVVWKDKPEQLLPRSKLKDWIGDSCLATETKLLEFYSDSPVLKSANFVDTPGMRSVIESHEDTINEFLSTKWNRESARLGKRADAIIYVIPGTARASDEDRLAAFSESRIPGSSPMNSIAVMHKWDALDEDDPFGVMASKASRLAVGMKELVATVIPVSAPLYIAATRFDEDFWRCISSLVGLPMASLDDLTLDETEFRDIELPEPCLKPAERAGFRQKYPIPWQSLRMIIRQSLKCEERTPTALSEHFRKQSRIPELKEELDSRFFARSKLVKALGVVNRAWNPGYQAVIRLRNAKQSTFDSMTRLPLYAEAICAARKLLADPEHRALMDEVADFIGTREKYLKESLRLHSESLSVLDQELSALRKIHDEIEKDLVAIDQLTEVGVLSVPAPITNRLLSIFGYHGMSVRERLQPWMAEHKDKDDLIDALDSFLDQLGEIYRTSQCNLLLKHAEKRIEQILEFLEK